MDSGGGKDLLAITCQALDAYETTLCSTNLHCTSPADCPTQSPLKCAGAWDCAKSTCAFKCPP